MIHYSCDLCNRELDPEEDVRFAVKVEVVQAFEPLEDNVAEDDREYLREISEIIEQLDDSSAREMLAIGPQVMSFDLCDECRKKFARDPLGREVRKQFDFSSN